MTPVGVESEKPRAKRVGPRRPWLILPLVLFVALAMLLVVRLYSGDPSRLPSALIDRPAPQFDLPPIETGARPGLASEDLARGVHVVNFWASWCVPCRLEHPLLMQLAGDKRFELVGVDYKDVPENAARFVGALGNPFARIGADHDGKAGIDWGVYGVPETFVVKDGVVRHKFVGPLSEDALARDLMPAIEKALAPG